MSKTYYIFLAITCVVSLGLGFILRGLFFVGCEIEGGLSLKDIKGESDSKKAIKDQGCDFYVDVSGAVMNPSVVCVHDGAIVNDAIVKADGFNPSAYAFKYVAQRINLARVLESEEKIYIPFRDDVVCKFVEDEQVKHVEKVMKNIQLEENSELDPGGFLEEKVLKDDGCISINDATKEKIMELKGIGEAKAQDIVDGRPYSKVEDLKNVKGIGEKTFESLEPFICL